MKYNNISKFKLLKTLSFLPFLLILLVGNVYSQVSNEKNLNVTQELIDLLTNTNKTSDQKINLTNTNENLSSINSTQNNVEKDELLNTNENFQTIYLGGIELPEGALLHLYNTYPYYITHSQIIAKLPCNELNHPSVNILIGQIPNLRNANLSMVENFKDSTDLCFYIAKIESSKNNSIPISDIFIKNNLTDDIKFPATSSVILRVPSVYTNN